MNRPVILTLALLAALSVGCGGEADDAEQGDPAAEKAVDPPPPPPAPGGPPAQPLTLATIPMPEGAKFATSVRDTRTIVLRGVNDLPAIRAHFDEKLAGLGWTADASSEVIDGVGFLDYRKGALRITITLNPDRDGESMTYILQGSGIDPPEDDDGDQ